MERFLQNFLRRRRNLFESSTVTFLTNKHNIGVKEIKNIGAKCVSKISLMPFSDLTHVDGKGKAHMVDVGDKLENVRTAIAEATVQIGKEAAELIEKNLIKKGDVLTVAQIAGIMGAKKTSHLIPLCHNINLSQVKLDLKLDVDLQIVNITSFVKCTGKTGVEMEALTGVTVAALTIYDMCKAINKGIVINNVRLLEKTGGKSGDYNVN